VVVDEFGGTSGICTLEDLVEEIFGDIEDEHDQSSYTAKRLPNGEYELSGRLEVEKANELLDLKLPESDDYLTIGGLILHEVQRFPKLNEVVRFGGFEFKVIKNTSTKIELVRLRILPD
jgi:CBS domain containing-hemolysin-like protein